MTHFFIFIIVVLLAYGLCRLAPIVGLVAYPGEHRKHLKPTPLVGGIAIFSGLLLGLALADQSYLGLLPAMTLLFAVGLLDDRYKLPSWLRFIAHALAAYLMIEGTGVQLTSLGDLLSYDPVQLGVWSTPVTIFAVIGVINAVNMSDGSDGLAASLVLLVMATILWLDPGQQGLVLVMIAALAGFLFWNLRLFRAQARIFMGDAGSTLLGLVVAYLLIKISQQPQQVVNPVTALWILALPLFDAVAALLTRPLRGKSPFSADRNHYHHLLQGQGFGANQTLLVAMALQASLIIVGVIMLRSAMPEHIQLLVFLICFSGYFLYIFKTTKP